MSANQRSGGTPNTEGMVIGAVALVIILGIAALWVAAKLAALTSGGAEPAHNPISFADDVATHSYRWPGAATVWLVVLLATVLAIVVGLGLAWSRHSARRGNIDASARNVVRDKGLSRYSGTRPAPGVFEGPGPMIGTVISGARISSARGLPGALAGRRTQLRATWEDMVVVIAGPRTGKTTSYAIPALLDCPGAAIVTSNKRDIVDATRGLREANDRTAWVFDPQGVAGARPEWWWNPLSYVVDVRSARKLAAVLTNASHDPLARTDAYFDTAGQELLAELLLGAASAGLAISAVFTWLSDSDDDKPVGLLRIGGHVMAADALKATIGLPDKQKAGVYGTAAKTISFLADPRVLIWVEDPGGTRPQFSPSEFVGSFDTLYSLSREGEGSSGPLVTALTAAVLEAAEAAAAASSGGRLAKPLLAVLDEVANVCRWRELPDLYSHYGSRGIVVLSILQSWAQGEGCWGPQGMRKLWDAANVKVFAGGSTDTRFLESLSQLYGHYDRRTTSASVASTGRSTTWANQRERVFSVDDLAAMPPGRAAVSLSGTRPVLVETMPWMARGDAGAVTASLARFGTPGGHRKAAPADPPAAQMVSGG